MEKIFDLGVESYVACKKQVPLQLTDYIVLFISTIVDIVKFSVLSFPCWIESIFYLFVSRPKKNVAGQVVLVDLHWFFLRVFFHFDNEKVVFSLKSDFLAENVVFFSWKKCFIADKTVF